MASYVPTYNLTDGTIAFGSQVRFELSALGSSVNNVINEQIPVGANISDDKLAQITTGQKVNTSALVTTSQAQGDILISTGATSWSRLGAGTAGQLLLTQGAGANAIWAGAQASTVTDSTDRTSGGAAYADVTSESITFTSTGGLAVCSYTATMAGSGGAGEGKVRIVDGSSNVKAEVWWNNNNGGSTADRQPICLTFCEKPAAGSVTYKVQIANGPDRACILKNTESNARLLLVSF